MQLYVHGDPLRDHLVAIIVPDPEKLAEVVGSLYKTTISPGDFSRLNSVIGDEAVIRAVLEEMNEEARKEKLKGYCKSL